MERPVVLNSSRELAQSVLQDAPLACPLDRLLLTLRDNSLVCSNGHCHDIAKQGYVNLLPVQFKRSRSPGDDAAMVAARRRVFDAGVYAPVADAVTAKISALATSLMGARSASLVELTLVDAGCGEGYYTDRFEQALRGEGADPSESKSVSTLTNSSASIPETRSAREVSRMRIVGTDISQPAIIAAARRYKAMAWAVANNTHLPVIQGQADIITSLFGFETWDAWAALQTESQLVVVVDAGKHHLIELREAAYEDVNVHDAPDDTHAIAAGYTLIESSEHAFQTPVLSADVLLDVFTMTPHAHKVGAKGHGAIRYMTAQGLTLDIVVRVYQRGKAIESTSDSASGIWINERD